ncbi:hypothetical protein [Agromyces larvae]|uniref:Uncharacterized protein n=1 Tax=Agromyces larvae TaxID=2929802 RepID=A0ABY4BXW3_9MICO|nr:hypothetical protein [Agromyces larvae]UOE43734.1 hypothetical protein MTO99_16420 [Agromyces larvae]
MSRRRTTWRPVREPFESPTAQAAFIATGTLIAVLLAASVLAWLGGI